MTFLSKMKNHPSAAVLQPFVTKHTNYCIKGTISSTFLELLSVAEKIISIVDLDSTKVPRKPVAKPSPKVTPEPEDGDVIALLAKNIEEQQESIKQIISMLASSDNQVKQFKVNCSKNDSSSGARFKKKAHSKQWENCTWHYCACLFKQGHGSWSPFSFYICRQHGRNPQLAIEKSLQPRRLVSPNPCISINEGSFCLKHQVAL
jgi:hypothetical protein